ncbi:MAG: secondary thiamine-phosphate synthase [Ponticaulis sp.]|nr:secondary thiamine-phosphate synthase [Ponticaulis sp.]|tara:strand:+ start:42201 stop:42617 length:417 start_codon:yes stop_codon:yes gene_type:complete
MLTRLTIHTTGPGLYEFAREIAAELSGQGDGLLTLFCQHTSASLTIQENADPDVIRDLQAFFARLVPHADDPAMSFLRHRTEGPDDQPAHIKSALTQVSLSIPVQDGRMMLGTWQGVYLFEHRDMPHTRHVVAQFMAS